MILAVNPARALSEFLIDSLKKQRKNSEQITCVDHRLSAALQASHIVSTLNYIWYVLAYTLQVWSVISFLRYMFATQDIRYRR